MTAKRKRTIVRAVCAVLYVVVAVVMLLASYPFYPQIVAVFGGSGIGSFSLATIFLVSYLLMAVFMAGPYWITVMGLTRLATDRRATDEELSDDNTVGDPIEGEKKLHHWLSGVQSSTAYFGMLPTSEPFRKPLPSDGVSKLLPRMSPRSRKAFLIVVVGAGVWLGLAAALAANGDGLSYRLVSGVAGFLLGGLLACPVGILMAVLIQREKESARAEGGTAGSQADGTADDS